MNEKNMLEQNRRDIMRQLGFRETAAAMDIIDPLSLPEAGESDIFSQRLAKGTLRHMTEAEFNAYNRGRRFGEWGQPVQFKTQPIAVISSDLFAPAMTSPAPAQQTPANARETAFGDEAWRGCFHTYDFKPPEGIKYTETGVVRELWEWPDIIGSGGSCHEELLITKASLKEIDPEMAGINDSIYESKRRIAAYEAGVDAIRLANKVVTETLESISGAGAALISRAPANGIDAGMWGHIFPCTAMHCHETFDEHEIMAEVCERIEEIQEQLKYQPQVDAFAAITERLGCMPKAL